MASIGQVLGVLPSAVVVESEGDSEVSVGAASEVPGQASKSQFGGILPTYDPSGHTFASIVQATVGSVSEYAVSTGEFITSSSGGGEGKSGMDGGDGGKGISDIGSSMTGVAASGNTEFCFFLKEGVLPEQAPSKREKTANNRSFFIFFGKL